MQATSLTRDVLGADDWFRIVVDGFNDNRTALGFAVTPAGVLYDFTVTENALGPDWNTFWDAAAVRTADGWQAEMRIPFSSLRFSRTDRGVVMGISAARYIAHRDEIVTFPALDPVHQNAEFRPVLFAKIVLDDPAPPLPLYVTPYALGGQLRRAESADVHADEQTTEGGVDMKVGLTPNLTLDLTVNTDFAQVEVDDEQVNLTRFSLFFPEKRQFFLEQAGTFQVDVGGFNDPSLFFHSRRVGLAPDGTTLRIWGGGRLVGRVGGAWDVGALDLQVDTPGGDGSENIGAVRVRRSVLNEESSVGAMVTTRAEESGFWSLSTVADTRLRLVARDYLTVQAGRSVDRDTDAGVGPTGMVRATWERPGNLTTKGVAYEVGFKRAGEEWNPNLGFSPRRDFTQLLGRARYGFHRETGFFRSLQPYVYGSHYLRNEDDRTDSAQYGTFLQFWARSGAYGWLGLRNFIENPDTELRLGSDATIPAGRHEFRQVDFNWSPSPGRLFGTRFQVVAGQFYDGTRLDLRAAPTWSVNQHLELGSEYVFSRIRFDERDEDLNADVARLRVRSALNRLLSTNWYLQYNVAARAVVSNLRLRLHLGEGHDVHLVYNHRMNTERDRVDPELPLTRERSVLLKWTRAFGTPGPAGSETSGR